MTRLSNAARIAMQDVLGLKKGEEVLILTNFEGDVFPIARALFDQTRKLGGRPVLVIQGKKSTFDYAERAVIEALKSEPDIAIAVTAQKLGKDAYGTHVGYVGRDGQKYSNIFGRLLDGDKRMRSFWSPGCTVDMFERTVPVDYAEMQSLAAKLKAVLDKGKKVKVKAPAGTDLTFSIKGREGRVDDGNFRTPGSGGNLPCGEAYVSPAKESAEGVIAFDGTLDLIPDAVIPKRPVRVVYEKGFVTEVTGGPEAKELVKVIERGEKMARELGKKDEERNARALGELGIGINFSAKMTCNMLEDEKVGKTVHFAIGANLENDANAMIHQDCLVKNPSLWIDGKQIMRDGKILL
jgi:aminopeptidase